MDAPILVLCANRHFTGVTVTFYRCFGRFTGFRDGQGECIDALNMLKKVLLKKKPGSKVLYGWRLTFDAVYVSHLEGRKLYYMF